MVDVLNLSTICTWIPGSELVGNGGTQCLRVSTDSRHLVAGDLFIALKGERFDGAAYLAQAKASGAVAALCEKTDRQRLIAAGLSGVLVDDARTALGRLAAAWRMEFPIPLIAVTGSNGKTTVTQMIAEILRAWQGEHALATRGNLNNDIGVPLTLLNLRRSHTVAVTELGMNHPGEISALAAMCSPTVALVNNAQREHQEFMASVDAVARENGSVFAALGSAGVAVFPDDDRFAALWRAQSQGRRCCTFSMDTTRRADIAVTVSMQPVWDKGAWTFSVRTPEGLLDLRLAVAGIHNVRNALAAVACATAAGVPPAAIEEGLNRFVAVPGRSKAEVWSVGGSEWTLIDDTYNANPDSVLAAVDLLCTFPGPRLLVLGDMGEVGVDGPAMHAEIGRYASSRGLDRVLTVGSLTSEVSGQCAQATHFAEWTDLEVALVEALPAMRTVLIKGSRFMKMERALERARSWVQSQTEMESPHAA